MAKQDKSRLARAVDRFNAAFGYEVQLPMSQEVIERLAELCDLRERPDLGRELRVGVKEALV